MSDVFPIWLYCSPEYIIYLSQVMYPLCSQYAAIGPQNIGVYILRICNHSVANIFRSPLNLCSIHVYIHIFVHHQWLYAFVGTFGLVIFELFILHKFMIETCYYSIPSFSFSKVAVMHYQFD